MVNDIDDRSYFTVLDSDDWWEPDYLEKLVSFAENNDLDIACTGSYMHIESTEEESRRSVERPIILEKQVFSEGLPYYHVFCRTTWGKLIKTDIVRNISTDDIPRLPYGGDTLYCFQALRHANRIGIDNSILHHYRIHNKSVSYQYDPRRFDADVYLYNDAIDFLRPYGPISQRNQRFLHAVYSNAVSDTLQVIEKASLPSADKLREYHRIAEHPITKAAYGQKDESAVRSQSTLRFLILQAGMNAGGQDDALQAAAREAFPNCGAALTVENLPLLTRETELIQIFLQDDRDKLMESLFHLITEKQYTKQFDLGAMVGSLIPPRTPLSGITDTRFYREYAEPCLLILGEQYDAALDQLAGMLFLQKKLYREETFLSLYLSLAALENQVPAFLFGKIRLADLYLREGRPEDCRAVLDELSEMGAGDHEDVIALRKILEGSV